MLFKLAFGIYIYREKSDIDLSWKRFGIISEWTLDDTNFDAFSVGIKDCQSQFKKLLIIIVIRIRVASKSLWLNLDSIAIFKLLMVVWIRGAENIQSCENSGK